MELESWLEDELPPEAREAVEAAEREIEKIRGKAERDAEKVRKKADGEIAAIQAKADEAVAARRREAAEKLKPLQEEYARAGKLDEALAIRARLRRLRSEASGVQPGPEVVACRPADVGKSFLYDVTGATDGDVWGTDVYTADSHLATAAVHAGVLKPGERGVVKVTVLDTSDRGGFEGTRRKGVTSDSWDEWDLGFRLSRP